MANGPLNAGKPAYGTLSDMAKTSLSTPTKADRPAGSAVKAGRMDAALKASKAVDRALRDSDAGFIVPRLTGLEAAEVMKAAGILTAQGKLTRSYR